MSSDLVYSVVITKEVCFLKTFSDYSLL